MPEVHMTPLRRGVLPLRKARARSLRGGNGAAGRGGRELGKRGAVVGSNAVRERVVGDEKMAAMVSLAPRLNALV